MSLRPHIILMAFLVCRDATHRFLVNDPNDWCDELGDPRYIIDLIKRVVTVSVKTMEIVDALPELP